jgi:hypothetical protein
MVLVKTIFLRLVTKNVEGAGTNGDPYLGIGGREFSIDSADEISIDTYVLGEH